MNELIKLGGPAVTMTSREIAELTGKELAHVHRDIRAMLDELKKDDPNLDHPQEDKDARGYTTCFHLNRELTETLLTGYSASARLKVIRRWHNLEAGAAPALNLRQPAQMLAVAMQLAEIVQEQQAKLTAQEPKVKFAEAVGASDDVQSVSVVAKALGTGERRLFAFMRDNGILMVNNLPFQHHLDAGRFKVIEKPWKDAEGNDRLRLQTMVTGKGITFLQQRLQKNAEAMHAQPH